MQMMFAVNCDRLVAPVEQRLQSFQPIAVWHCGRCHSFVHRLLGGARRQLFARAT